MKKSFNDLAKRCLVFILTTVFFAGFINGVTAQTGKDSKGNDFWLTFPENNSNSGTAYLYISGEENTTGNVSIPGLNFSQNFNVTVGQITTITLPNTVFLALSGATENKGIHITAVKEVTIYGMNQRTATTDAYLGLPTDVLGLDYMVMSYQGGFNGGQIGIVSTENNTSVSFKLTATTGAYVAGTTYSINLNQGQTFYLKNTLDLTGSVIVSNKPVAVFSGNQCANVPTTSFACDHLVEQMTPSNTWGKNFVSIPLKNRIGDTYRFLAGTNNTVLTINGAIVATLNRGQFFERIYTNALSITATEPILVAQYANGTSYDGKTGDPFMMLVSPYEQFLGSYTITTPATGFLSNFTNVVAATAAVGTIKLDGNFVSSNLFSPIGNSGFSGAQIDISVGTHKLTSNGLPFGVSVYGFNNADSYGYPAGSSYSPIASVSTIDITPKVGSFIKGFSNCISAKVLDQNNNPVEGVRVDFSIVGVNSSNSGFTNSDVNGNAVFCYVGNNAGSDIITASIGTLKSTSSIEWLPRASALNFDGQNDYVSTGNSLGNVGTGDFTIELNIRTLAQNGSYLFSKRSFCDNDNFISIGLNFGKVGFEISDGGSNYTGFSGSKIINDNQWHDIAITRKSGLVTILIDGVVDATAQNNANVSNNYIGTLGSSICNGQNTSVKYKGEMDEVRFWNRALCEGEILNNLNKELALPQTGLLAYYKMNQGFVNSDNSTENSLTDISGNNNTGTLTNFALTGTTSNWVAGIVSGIAPIFVAPVASITANGLLNFCPSGSVILSANAGTGLTYQWTKDGINIPSANLASYTANTTGNYNVIVTQNGCTALASAVTVTVQDNIPPVQPVLADITGQCSVTVMAAPTTTDNCAGTITGTTTNPLTYAAQGSYVIVWKFDDGNGNITTANQNVIVKDDTKPVFVTVNNVSVSTSATTNNALVTVPTPVVVDNCEKPTGNSLAFDGVNDIVSVSQGLPSMTEMTIETWLKPKELSNWDVILNYNTFNLGDIHFQFYPNKALGFSIAGNNPTDQLTSLTFDNKWYHFAVVYSATGKYVKFYLNGNLIDTRTYTTAIATAANKAFSIGGWAPDNRYFNGNLDDLRVWNVARTAEEIKVSMNSTLQGNETGLLAYYDFNQGVAGGNNSAINSVTDLAGGNHTGVLQNFALTGSNSNWTTGAPTTGINLVNDFNNTSDASGTYPAGSRVINWTATDAAGNKAFAQQTITVIDSVKPIVLSKNVTVQLNAAGNAVITPAQVNNGTTDNSGTFTLSLDKAVFDCSNIGVNLVTLTATDPSGNKATNTIPSGLIGLWDFKNANPLKDQTGNWGDLLVTGNASISNGKLDVNSGGMARTTSYTGATIGNKTLISYVSLDDLNLRAGSALTIDKINSDAFDGIIYAEGEPNRWMNGSSNASRYQDLNPGFAETKANQLIQVALTYEMQPNNQVLIKFYRNGVAYGSYTSNNFQTWSANDAEMIFGARHFLNGTQIGSLDAKIEKAMIFNRALSIAEIQQLITTVTVEDKIAPVIASKPISVTLTASGTVSITPQQVVQSGSDNCAGVITYTLSKSTFGATDAINSPVTVQLIGTDASGNASSVPVLVTVIDPVPVVITKNITVALDANGNVNITPQQVDNGSSSVVGLALEGGLVLDKTTFDCSNIGANTVKLTATSTLGSTAFANAIVTVIDSIKPIKPVLADLTGQCSVTVMAAPTTTDNCGTITGTTTNPLTYAAQGSYVIVWKFDDGHGNITAANQNVIVKDDTKPVFAAINNISVNTSVTSCDAVVTIPIPLATDNCEKVGNALKFDGINDYVSIPRSISGNFTIEYWMKTTQVGPNSTGSQWYQGIGIVDAEVGGVTNDFGTALLGNRIAFGVGNPDRTIFSTVPVNTGNWVHIAATRNQANGQIQLYVNGVLQSTGTGSTNLLDQPSRILLGLMQTGANGYFNGSLTNLRLWNTVRSATQILTNMNASVSGQVGLVANYGFNQGVANGNNTGINTLVNEASSSFNGTLSGFGLNGNNSNWVSGVSSSSVTLSNNINNTADASGKFPIGPTVITWTATDAAGNVATTQQTITVIDSIKPKAFAQNKTVQLDATGNASITVADINNGSSDNCSIANLTLDKTTFTGANIGPNTVILTVTDVSGNISSSTAIVTVEDKIAPIFTSSQADVIVALDANNGTASLVSYTGNATATDNSGKPVAFTQSPAAGAALVQNVPLTVTLTATDASGNFATQTFTVTATDQTAPVALAKNITVQLDATGNAVITPQQVDNSSTDNVGITSFTLSKTAFDCSNVASNTVTLTVKDASGNVSIATAVVTVEDKIAPIVLTQNKTIQLNSEGLASITAADIDNGSTDNCSIASIALSKTAFDCSNVGANTVTLTVTDVNGNISTNIAVVTVEDKIAPIVLTQNKTIQLNSEGLASITAADIDNGSSDNCSIASIVLSKTAFDCSNVGANTVTLTVTDVNGNVSTATAIVTVEDKIAPIVITQNRTIQLNAAGTASITTADINNGSTDNCSIASIVLSKTAFDCSNVGANTVILTVTDVNGNISTNTAVVTVEDNVKPIVLTQNRTIQLNAAGTASITAADINNGSTDNCSIASIVLSKTAFDCSNVGANTVILTVTDVNGNISTNTAVVTVEDKIAPIVITQNRTIQLNAAGTASITAADIDNGSKDNCSIASIALSKTSFDCSNVGPNTVTLTVTDVNGNVSTKDALVTVEDKIAPTVFTQNRTIQLNAAGSASITAADIDNGSTDNCSIASIALSKTAFTCDNVGPNTVTLTITDVNGNKSTKDAVVTVEDNIKPTVITQNITVDLVGGRVIIVPSQIDNGSFDNCGIKTYSLSKTEFDCSSIGIQTVTLTITDKNGNVNSKTATVKVVGELTSSSIASVPTSTTYTGGVSTNLYLGYGAQSTTLQVSNMVVGGNGTNPKTYTYAWSGSAVSQLSSTTSGAPVFTPTSAGYYTFNVLVTNKYGCTSAATISICVKDIREVTVDKKGVKSFTGKVYICHAPPGNVGNSNTLSISVNAVDSHLSQHSYDRLGSCSEAPCSGTSGSMSTNSVNDNVTTLSNLTLTVEPSKLIAYPNPFNHNTTVSFKVPYAESNATLDIYDVRGVRIQNLYRGSANANQDYEVKFDGSNIAAGTYFLRLSTSKEVKDFKLVMTN